MFGETIPANVEQALIDALPPEPLAEAPAELDESALAEINSLPLAVLEASTAVTGHGKSEMMSAEKRAKDRLATCLARSRSALTRSSRSARRRRRGRPDAARGARRAPADGLPRVARPVRSARGQEGATTSRPSRSSATCSTRRRAGAVAQGRVAGDHLAAAAAARRGREHGGARATPCVEQIAEHLPRGRGRRTRTPPRCTSRTTCGRSGRSCSSTST